jgi:RNA polymerase sigma factor (sigma-70 family)
MPPAADVAALMREYAGLILRLARIVEPRANKACQRVTLGELKAAGAVGLWQAAERWDGRAGVKFSTFAGPRIRGAMLDWVREASPFPRAWKNPPFLRSLKPARRLSVASCQLSAESRDAFRAMLADLWPDERLMLSLRYEAGMEVSEAARAVGVCTRTGYMIHDRAIAKVRERLAA